TGHYGGATTMKESLVVVARHRDARQEGLLLELLLAACQMYCAGMSGDRMPEAEKKFRDATLRMASVAVVPPERFDAPRPGGPPLSSRRSRSCPGRRRASPRSSTRPCSTRTA